MPAGQKVVELWLPQFGRFGLRGLFLDAGARVERFEDSRPRWITYGSSITQCRTAASSSATWPALVARKRGLHLTCLGFGGACCLEPMVALTMRDLPADMISICAGINIHGSACLSERTFREMIIGFVRILREKHRDAPLVVISPVFSPPRETGANRVGFTLQGMRQEVEKAVGALQKAGDDQIHYVDGLELFGQEDAAHLPDDLHPDAEGYRILARKFDQRVASVYFNPS